MTGPNFKVLTYNLYLGGDVAPLIGAPSADLPGRADRLWRSVQGTNWPARARAIAASIAKARPDVVALQEVYRWTRIDTHAGAEVVHDFLASILDELAVLGATYICPVRAWGVTVELPTASGPAIRFDDSVAILLRTATDDVDGKGEGEGDRSISGWSRPRQGRFATSLNTRFDGEPFAIPRPWASIDIAVGTDTGGTDTGGTDTGGTETVRVITTHLEYFGEGIQAGQVTELLDGPVAVGLPIILLGDFNQTPHTPVWHLLNRRGFVDTWLVAGHGTGATSGQGGTLRNLVSTLGHRIDWILVRGGIDVAEVSLVGDQPDDRTPDGLWPSDHAGVLATVQIRPEPADVESREALFVAKELYACFVRQDLEGAQSLIDPHSHWSFPGDPAILPWAGNYRGAEIARFLHACVASLDYLEYVAHTFHLDGDVVTVRSNERCRVKRTGRIFRHDLTAVIRVRNGKIVQFVEYADTAAMHAAFAD